jgi:hypothetical protein
MVRKVLVTKTKSITLFVAIISDGLYVKYLSRNNPYKLLRFRNRKIWSKDFPNS